LQILTGGRIAGVTQKPKDSSFSMKGPIVSPRPKAIHKNVKRICFQKVAALEDSEAK